mmetsp:Transcript_7744/g.19380  ORF Transcript_7744/g.19380 Transcript_7744/m.19380 type:complete len:229 (-) Transcript_7744:408-1094(-)
MMLMRDSFDGECSKQLVLRLLPLLSQLVKRFLDGLLVQLQGVAHQHLGALLGDLHDPVVQLAESREVCLLCMHPLPNTVRLEPSRPLRALLLHLAVLLKRVLQRLVVQLLRLWGIPLPDHKLVRAHQPGRAAPHEPRRACHFQRTHAFRFDVEAPLDVACMLPHNPVANPVGVHEPLAVPHPVHVHAVLVLRLRVRRACPRHALRTLQGPAPRSRARSSVRRRVRSRV